MTQPIEIKINLATGRHLRPKAPFWLLAMACAIAAILSVFNAYTYITESAFISANKELASGAQLPTGAGLEGLKSEVKIVNAILDKKSFSWVELFSRFEDTVPEGVSLTQVTPDFSTGDIRIRGEGKSLERVLAFVERLNSSKHFDGAFLLEHHEAGYGGADSAVIGFDLKAVYKRGVGGAS